MPEAAGTPLKLLLVAEGKHEHGGALEALVRRCLPSVKLTIESGTLSHRDFRAAHGGGPRLLKKAARVAAVAAGRGCDAAVMLIDEDGDRSRVGDLDAAQNHPDVPLPHAVGVAVRSFDAWMLADHAAVSAALGVTVQRQKDPEEMKDPKGVFAALLAGRGLGQAEAYRRVAEAADVAEVARRCPAGFGPFCERLRALEDS